MRIASQQFSNMMIATLRSSNSKAADLSSKLATGQRVQRASDDPIAAVRLLLLERDTALTGRYSKNIDTLSVKLQGNEAHLDSMLDSAMSAHDSMLMAVDGSRSPADLNALAGPLRTLLDNLAKTANATDSDGNYLFSGTLTSTPAVSYDPDAPVGSRYAYTGNQELQQVVIGNGVTQAANVTVEPLADALNKLDAAIAVMASPDVDPNDPDTRAILSASVDSLKHSGIEALAAKISGLGGAQNTLDLMKANHEAQLVANGQAAALVGELDFAQAFDEFNNYLTAMKGTYEIYGRLKQLSLFDVI